MFQSLKDLVSSVKANLETQVARFANKKFLDAAVAVCARIAAADGTIGKEEQQKMFQFMSIFPALKVFTPTEVLESWNRHIQFYDISTAMGHAEANKSIAVLAGNTDASTTVVHLGAAIGGSDGDFDDTEKDVLRDIISILGLRAADFGL
jgi:tellurite resistance protein TerB